jgi:hypothetical protein
MALYQLLFSDYLGVIAHYNPYFCHASVPNLKLHAKFIIGTPVNQEHLAFA